LPPGDEDGREAARRNPLKAKARYGAANKIGGLDLWTKHRQTGRHVSELVTGLS
jgi:hypothetical protein